MNNKVGPAHNMSLSNAFTAYRNLLRASRIAFRSDLEVLQAARSKMREEFAQKDSDKPVEERIEHANAVAKFLVQNVVQGVRREEDKYTLNIHNRTELGDNNTIKQKKSDMGSLAGATTTKRCSGN